MKRSVIPSALIALASPGAASPQIAATPVTVAKGDPSVNHIRRSSSIKLALRANGETISAIGRSGEDGLLSKQTPLR